MIDKDSRTRSFNHEIRALKKQVQSSGVAEGELRGGACLVCFPQDLVRTQSWPFWSLWGFSFLTVLVLGCSQTARRKYPWHAPLPPHHMIGKLPWVLLCQNLCTVVRGGHNAPKRHVTASYLCHNDNPGAVQPQLRVMALQELHHAGAVHGLLCAARGHRHLLLRHPGALGVDLSFLCCDRLAWQCGGV